jgi:PIN domain nuclease of toxin-antitoxin system
VILLDTHVLLWLDQNSDRLGERTREVITSELKDGAVAVSAITFWEVAMLVAKGRISTALDLARWREDLLSAGLLERPWTALRASWQRSLMDCMAIPSIG